MIEIHDSDVAIVYQQRTVSRAIKRTSCGHITNAQGATHDNEHVEIFYLGKNGLVCCEWLDVMSTLSSLMADESRPLRRMIYESGDLHA